MASLTRRRRAGLTLKTQHFEEEESNPAWAFAQLRCFGFGLVTVSHTNLVSLIRISRPSAHRPNVTGEAFLPPRERGASGRTARLSVFGTPCSREAQS